MLAVCIFFIFLIYAYNTSNTIKKLEKENKLLKKELHKVREVLSKQNNNNEIKNQPVQQNIANNHKNENLVDKQKILERLEKNKEDVEREERERKNTGILIAGALLIVLAAIVFLMSTWNIISNVIKTIIIVLLAGVFLGASKIAKEKFNLEKASNTFFYIAMAYIPICLVYCSLTGLFGEYFSIIGDGRYLYLAFCFIVTSGIYYYYYKNKNSDVLFIGTFLTQILAVILFTLIFENSILLIGINLLLYNILLISLKDKFKKIDLLSYFYKSIPYIVGIISICFIFEFDKFMIVLLPLLAINFWLTKNKLNCYLFEIIIYTFGFYIAWNICILENLKIIFSTVYVLLVFLLEQMILYKNKELAKNSVIISSIFVALIYLNVLNINVFIKPYMISIVEMLILFIGFIKSNKTEKSIFGYLISICFIITGLNILSLVGAKYYWYIIFSLINFIISEIIIYKNLDILKLGILGISHTFIGLTFLGVLVGNYNELLNNVFIIILLELTYIYSFIKYKEYSIFKYLSYIFGGLVLYSIANIFGIPKMLVPLTITIIILVLESKYQYLRDNYSSIIAQIITYLSLILSESPISILLTFLFSVYLLYDNLKNEKIAYLRCIPDIGLLTVLYLNEYTSYESYQIILMLLSAIGLTVISFYQKGISIDTIFSGIYLLCALDNFDNNIIQEIFFVIWSLSNMYFMDKRKEKDIFKGISYVGIFCLYNTIIKKLSLDDYAASTMIGVTIFAIALIKTIIKQYNSDTDNIEYLAFSLINIVALVGYTDEFDGMLYVLFIVGVLIYSYIRKYGAIFIVSLITIILNVLILTRMFWLLIPWWIYLLVIGFILIGFAIKNESDEKRDKISMGNTIKKIKDKVEK